MCMKDQINCNCCGKILVMPEEIIKTDFIQVKKKWGYFSQKDGRIHECYICEECYDKWVEGFLIPPRIEDATELL